MSTETMTFRPFYFDGNRFFKIVDSVAAWWELITAYDGDVDNLLKAILDSLVKAKVMKDDSLIDQLTITRRSVAKGGRVVVTIQPYEEV